MTRSSTIADGRSDGREGFVIYHGLAGTASQCEPLKRRLQQAGFEVAAPTIEGLAGGTDPHDQLRWRDWQRQANAAVAELLTRCDRVHVAGLCTGALLASLAAREMLSSRCKLIMIAPTLRIDGWAIPKSLRFFSLVHDRIVAGLFRFDERPPFGIKNDNTRAMILAALAREADGNDKFFSISGRKMLEFQRLSRHVRHRLQDVVNPTLVLHSARDDQSSVRNATEVCARLKQARVELQIFQNSYHELTLDNDRREVLQRVCDFVTSDQVAAPVLPETLPEPAPRIA